VSAVNNYVIRLPIGHASATLFMSEVNSYFKQEYEIDHAFRQVDNLAGGTKAMELGLYISALNGTEPEEVSEVIVAAREKLASQLGDFLRCDGDVQLLVQTHQNGEKGLVEFPIPPF